MKSQHKRNKYNLVICLLVAIMLPIASFAQEVREKSESVMIYFKQGSSIVDRNYMENGKSLEHLAEILEAYVIADAKVKGRVCINASASPEGSANLNKRLINARAKAIADWIGKRFNTSIGYEIAFQGFDWVTLLKLVEESSAVPHKSEVIDIIKNTPEFVTRNGVLINERERLIERLHGGESYRWLLKNIYPRLRYSAVESYVMYAVEITITTESPVKHSAEGGSGVIAFEKNVTDNYVPKAYAQDSWVTDVKATESQISYVVEPNLVAEARKSVITIEAYGTKHEVVVEQEAAAPAVAVKSALPVAVGAEGGSVTLAYETNVPNSTTTPEVTTTAEWISDIKCDEFGEISFVAAENTSLEPRSAILKINYMGTEQEVRVEQASADPQIIITSDNPVEMGAKGGSAAVAYDINVPDATLTSVSTDADWITSIKASEDDVTFKVRRNRLDEPRSASLLLESGNLASSVLVNQALSECNLPAYLSLQTNLLYDLLITPNIGVEFYLGKNFSVDANWHYAWWKNDNTHFYWRTYGGDLAVRWWFGPSARLKPLTGHHVGIYGQMITYDFEFGRDGILGDRWTYAAGVEYGYSLPIAERLNLDFTLGLGYLWGEFYEYKPIDGHYVWQATKHRRYMGPTKCEISLVWLLGCDNYNRGKR